MPEPLEALREQVAELRALVEALGDEVRARRVVVVDAAGRPRIVLGVEPGVATIRVDAEGGDPSVELYVVDAIDADGPEVGIALVAGGDVVEGLRRLTRP